MAAARSQLRNASSRIRAGRELLEHWDAGHYKEGTTLWHRGRAPGMRGVYAHVTPAMRADLLDGLQGLWEASLAARQQLAAGSAVPVLDRLLRSR
jgi:hypothetical protein